PALPIGRRRSTATGTRKNITVQSLVPYDAPIQPRKYASPSATSRKELPAVFAKKRARSQAFGEECVDDSDPQPPPNATEREQIEWKRRQNTLAARKSRKRKLEHQQMMEAEIASLKEERDMWKTRAMMLQAVVKENGISGFDF
ncbi:hypothetical protein FISHEDRAFT_12872, partial [Fistulina hepatica ATCC 64428]